MTLAGRRVYWAYIALAVAAVAAIFGFGGYARGTAATIAQIVFFACLVIALDLVVRHFLMRRGSGPAA